MTSDQTNHQTGHPIHFVGSIPLADAETVFRTLAVAVGDRATRWPDGETGDRTNWIRWQQNTFENHPDFQLRVSNISEKWANDSIERPLYVFRDGADPAAVRIETMGYAAEAIPDISTSSNPPISAPASPLPTALRRPAPGRWISSICR